MPTLSKTNTFPLGDAGVLISANELNANYDDMVNYVNSVNSGNSVFDAISVLSATDVPLIVNSTGGYDAARFQDNGANAYVIDGKGCVTSQYQSGVVCYGSNTTLPSAGTITKLKIDGSIDPEISYDVKSEFDETTNYNFTASVTGKYLIMYRSLIISGGLDGSGWTMYIYKNSSAYSSSAKVLGAQDRNDVMADLVSLTAADTIDFRASNETGVDMVVRGTITITKVL